MTDWEDYWKSKSLKRKAIEFAREKYFTKIFCDVIEKKAGKKASILEAGCGSGTYLRRLSAKGHNCHGVDNSKESVERAKVNCNNVFYGDIHNLSKQFDGKIFDVVFNQGVMEHFEDEEAEKIYEEMKKIAKKVMIFVPSNLSLFRLFDIFKEEDDKSFFSRKRLKKSMQKSFKNVEVKYIPGTFFLTLVGYAESD